MGTRTRTGDGGGRENGDVNRDESLGTYEVIVWEGREVRESG